MTDISKCKGLNCPLKLKCYRYTAKADEHWQSYLGRVPYDEKTESCSRYWSNKD